MNQERLTFNHQPSTLPEILDLSNKEVITTQDLIQIESVPPSNQTLDLIKNLNPKDQFLFFYQYQARLQEIWEDLYSDQDWESFLDSYLATQPINEFTHGQVIVDQVGNHHHWIPDIDDMTKLIESRLFPLLSHQEIETLNNSTVLLIGASTASLPGMFLAQLGVRNFIIVDPDQISVSNRNRIYGATLESDGINKAAHLAMQMVHLNPQISVTAFPKAVSKNELQELIQKADIVLEMCDHLPTKLKSRQIIRQLDQDNVDSPTYLAMATNVDQPLISLESANDDLFLRTGMTEDDVNNLINAQSPSEFITGVIDIIGLQNIPQRQLINFILLAKGELKYMAQHGASAAAAGWGISYTIQKILTGTKLSNSEKTLSIDDMFDPYSQHATDAQYLQDLKQAYPEIFNKFVTLPQAVQVLLKETLAIDWPSQK